MKNLFALSLLFCSLSSISQIQYAYGSYTGNGAATRAITGLGFEPDAIYVKADGAEGGWMATSTMTAGTARRLNITTSTATETGYISSINSDGFTVSNTGGAANTNGTTYHYVAFLSAANCKVGSYTGNGSDRAITGLGFQPEMIFLLQDFTDWQNEGTICGIRGRANEFFIPTNSNGGGNYIASYDADGFTAKAARGSVNTKTYHYVAFNDDNTSFDMFTYTGDGVDDRSISTSFQPYIVFIADNSISTQPIVMKSASMSGDKTVNIGNAAAATTNMIQALNTTNFQVGTNALVNNNTITFYAMSFGTSVLPVELLSFEGKKENNSIQLQWKTASEINSSYFDIQRSSDGVHFLSIAKINAAGFSNSILDYTYNDEQPYDGMNYYKIIPIDADGSINSEKIISIDYSNNDELLSSVTPNPCRNEFSVFFSKPHKIYHITISDDKGSIVKKFTVSNLSSYTIDENLAAGIYFVHVTSNNYSNSTKLIKY